MVETYQSYVDFVEQHVIPVSEANPAWKQINGQNGVSTRKAVAYVMHKGAKYKVDGDSDIEALLAPYRATQRCIVSEILVVSKTRTGTACLIPSPGAGERRKFYIYRV